MNPSTSTTRTAKALLLVLVATGITAFLSACSTPGQRHDARVDSRVDNRVDNRRDRRR
jgi:hypothetical protein